MKRAGSQLQSTISQEHIAALYLMTANFDVLGAFDPQGGDEKSYRSQIKVKDINIMKQEIAVSLRMHLSLRAFPYHAI